MMDSRKEDVVLSGGMGNDLRDERGEQAKSEGRESAWPMVSRRNPFRVASVKLHVEHLEGISQTSFHLPSQLHVAATFPSSQRQLAVLVVRSRSPRRCSRASFGLVLLSHLAQTSHQPLLLPPSLPDHHHACTSTFSRSSPSHTSCSPRILSYSVSSPPERLNSMLQDYPNTTTASP